MLPLKAQYLISIGQLCKDPPIDLFRPIMLNAEDYILKSKRQKLNLPKLLSPRLPEELLTRFSIPQLRVENIYVEHKNPEKTPETEIKRLSHDDIARKLKHKAGDLFESQKYMLASACFLESYLLFTAEMYTKGLESQVAQSKPKNNRVSETDWIELVKYGVKITKRLNSIGEERESSARSIRHIIGLCYFVNAFILKLLLEAKEKRLKLLLDVKETESSRLLKRMKTAVEKLLRVQDSFHNSMRKGEKYLPTADLIHKYPRLAQNSKSLSEVESEKLIIPTEEQGFGETNYTLPIAGHTLSLRCVVNLGFYFVREWCKQENIDYRWSF